LTVNAPARAGTFLRFSPFASSRFKSGYRKGAKDAMAGAQDKFSEAIRSAEKLFEASF